MDQSPRYTPEALQAFATRAFASAGLPETDATTIARDLVKANLRGLDSHGVPAFPCIWSVWTTGW